MIEVATTEGNNSSTEALIKMTTTNRQLSQSLGQVILKRGIKEIIKVMTTSKDNSVRRQAAAYAASIGQQDANSVAKHVVRVYDFNPNTKSEPWAGGALFVPSINWSKTHARDLVDNLIRWMVWCDRNGRQNQIQQIVNNLNSLQLRNAAGFQFPGWNRNNVVNNWLEAWRKVVGRAGIEDILEEQKADRKSPYRKFLE